MRRRAHNHGKTYPLLHPALSGSSSLVHLRALRLSEAQVLIPLSNHLKTKVDICAISTAGLSYLFQSVPWSEVAAFLAALYTTLRIVEFLVAWWKGRKPNE